MCIINPFPPCHNTINTGSGDDNVHISKAPGLLGALGYYDVNINGHHQLMTKSQLENTTFNLGDGNDKLVVDANVTADITANGGRGDDVMIGGAGDDKFNGGSGRDLLWGRGGVNELNGGRGDDVIVNTGGINRTHGGQGDDTIINAGGWNHNDGDSGNDAFVNLGGVNTNHGGSGWDTFANFGGFNNNKQWY